MKIIDKVENGPVLICPDIHKDDRGYFYESFNTKEFVEKVAEAYFVQDNQSCSSYGVIRGMHFQTGEYAQAKLVRVVKGAVLDVVVDNRKDSENYGKYYEYLLTEDNHYQLFVPKGFAHGFLTLKDDTVFQYKCDEFYHKESEGSFKYDSFGFDWGKYVNPSDIIVSAKDDAAPVFNPPTVKEEIDKDEVKDFIRSMASKAISKMTGKQTFNMAYDIYKFTDDIFAEVKRSNGDVIEVKLKETSPLLFDPSDIFPVVRILVTVVGTGEEFALTRDFEEVIRFYKYKK